MLAPLCDSYVVPFERIFVGTKVCVCFFFSVELLMPFFFSHFLFSFISTKRIYRLMPS